MDDATKAQLATAVATLFLGLIAVLQRMIWRAISHPVLEVSADQVWTPVHDKSTGVYLGKALYLRLRIKSAPGKGAARKARVAILRVGKHEGTTFRRLHSSEYPRHLIWSNTDPLSTTSAIDPGTEALVDVAHINEPRIAGAESREPRGPATEGFRFGTEVVNTTTAPTDPKSILLLAVDRDPLAISSPRETPSEENTNQRKATAVPHEGTRATVALDVLPRPLSQAHLLGPGRYRCVVLVSGSNMDPKRVLADIEFFGSWSERMADMVRFNVMPGDPYDGDSWLEER